MKKTKSKKIFIGFFFLILFLGIIFYKLIFANNSAVTGNKSISIKIPTHSTYQNVFDIIKKSGTINDLKTFDLLASCVNYSQHSHPGLYSIKKGMSNFRIIRMLYAGRQTPVNVTFNNVRLKSELAGKISKLIEADSTALLNLLNNAEYLKSIGMTPETSLLLCLPNTYEFWWNTTAEQFIQRMAKEYNEFWNQEKIEKAKQIGLTPTQISILASIIEQETNNKKEMSRIAGVYINRYKSGMKLQADPTVKFALQDFSIKRILFVHTKVESPYNTYKYEGFPPGPICLPSTSTIEKVLNYENHDYLFFCAKDDFSGQHIFAKTYAEHKQNAKKYQQALSN